MKFLEKVGEAALEIILSLIMFLVGLGVLSLLGIELGQECDTELILLIGSVIFLVIFIAIAFLVNKYKSKRKDGEKKDKSDE